MNGFVSAALAASSYLALAFASGCANDTSVDGKSGETHFLCSIDQDCEHHFGNDEYYCGSAKYCVQRSWHVTPDGYVTTTEAWARSNRDAGPPVQKMLDIAQMSEIVIAVRGPDLRLAMRDGIPCASNPGTDLSVKFSLELSTQTMTSGEVSGCIDGDNVYAGIYKLLSQ